MSVTSFVRNNFFSGRLLTGEDFQRESEYHRGKRGLLNRLFVGSGVVAGLDVVSGSGKSEVVVGPGLALDGWGREIVVVKPVCVAIPKPFLKNARNKWVHLVVSYAERMEAPMPMLSPAGGSTTQPTLIREIAEFRIVAGPMPVSPLLKNFRSRRKLTYAALVRRIADQSLELPQNPGVPLADIRIPSRKIDLTMRPIGLSYALLNG